ncbi:hypothetical protein [Maribacter sp. 2307ULW6-5]|uniref:hypothetical protein n=1 Tax=Maribacter sp. 2307ULW6-5 TaxID=3386275 RepID=UPI0039BD25A4
MMISCEKATLICNKTQYGEASFLDILKLRYHLYRCQNCAKATERNTKLTTLCEKAKLYSLKEEDKEKMKALLKK